MRIAQAVFAGVIGMSMLATATVAEARRGVIHAHGSNGAVTAAKSANGGAAVRGRGVRTNDDGSVTRASGGAYRTASGARGARARTTTVNPDGTVTHDGGARASGARGSFDSSGSSQRDADGNWTGTRSTNATSGATGNSYSGSTTFDSATRQVTHTGTCTNAAGEIIACPR